MSQSELIPYSVVDSLRHNFELLLIRKYFRNIYDKILHLYRDIKMFDELLSDADQEQDENPAIKVWIRRLKDVLYTADDLFDEVVTQALLIKHGKVGGLFSCINEIYFQFQIALQIEKLRHRVDMRGLFTLSTGMPEEHRSNLGQRWSETTSMLGSDMIGRKDEKMEIISLLMKHPADRNQNVSLIGVVGIGGIGKTAVAQMVYNDKYVKCWFEIRAWVYVSSDFDFTRILYEILDSLNCKVTRYQSLEELIRMLHENLIGKRYLLVLDDIWAESLDWSRLNQVLMCGAQGSKILVTTRSTYVSEAMEGIFLFHLKSLNEEDSWSLLKKLVFRNDENLMTSELEQVGKKIVKKCRGVPMAIRTVSVVLRAKYRESEWATVLETDFWKLNVEDGIMHALKLSYQRLSPRRLKQCFAYCSMYPKGSEIEKNELIQLWKSQDYLRVSRHFDMEDDGNQFVDILLGMSFFQDAKFDECGNLVSFKMHDLIHELALLVACNDYSFDSKRRVNTPIHMRLSLESNNIDLLGSLNASRLRTFVLQQANDRETGLIIEHFSLILRFKRLRALNLSHSSLKKLPYLIGELKHLRYLDLSWSVKLARLPKSIGNLVNLQTLKLTGCETLEFSTEVVTKLIKLRHLMIHRCKAFEDMMPTGLEKLSSLQSLSSFYVVDDRKKKPGKLNELQNLNHLRGSLEIHRLDKVRDVTLESHDVNLKEKKLLESLDLNWESQDKAEHSLQLLENLRPHQHLKRLQVRCYPGDRFSDWLSAIKNLSYIHLFGFDNCKFLPPLEHLPYLKSLEISSMKVLEYIYFEVVSYTATIFFQSLEKLKLSGCENFKGWKRMEGAEVSVDNLSLPQFHHLSELIINKCPKLTDLPTFPNVEELQLCEPMVKPLKETLDMASSSSSTPLSMLKSLKVEGKLPDINVLPSQWKQNLTSLEHLEIVDVDNLDIWFEDNLPSLQKVVVYGCDLKALPSKMCDFLSLQHIKMMGCHNLASLPKEMVQLTKLVTLEIQDCPLLVERCQKETGIDWPQISKVPNIILEPNL